MKLDFTKGLVPAVVIDDQTNEVLMLAYMNEEAYEKTLETKETWFYSRSRESLWHKGETSGNTQTVKSIRVDCDADTLLVRVDPKGPACHTGEKTCFYREIPLDGEEKGQEKEQITNNQRIYDVLMEEIESRKEERMEGSYTNYLFDKGVDKISKKFIEEAGEVIIAAKNNSKEELIYECSDLIYHCFVLLANQHVSLQEVEQELWNRTNKKGNSKGDRAKIEKW
ncbi:bifunctional phosphoribosyl-AMP cyclohydrolase/phosphoribosyl-ATP diphosphatase HisIE [Heyndrickxia ginsengihumi]|uniref:Histidine biosynthesis bifunctional protein HisIE n=1 Tax=Heyndrickxia ginsengihumi TaxID=363870 RepID=A0A6M0P5Q7_9BACI|nr:bifunctional phosphoribosyl-AMP cyclohydrolase/phosphoribosyl-ATP diphosphatase HisIE [Heyndrickxia ginsengihumi]MBE6185580.1 bifunctional phosphoribosyl-AMP cyclohydrolase/phosphoribosyl-ATP diphosphatase HisIE [Bacillus sp. (in: firmicutes)]MCM3024729.1 bifunctional phosphoribosyl-AMP cyclohydrolase/phosphoribosyl-ATP diphosphatase HisIE [Heyndrickxia ginsengihumi]NEY19803.1 bifunctional phosphoribosyl-AMP cyclohydrolase/phosphoribosyl-ATP diphosphatase HisIE [Heyndrickxia ginsengihumi]